MVWINKENIKVDEIIRSISRIGESLEKFAREEVALRFEAVRVNIVNLIQSIDWAAVDEHASQFKVEVQRFSKRMAKENIFLNDDYLELASFTDYQEYLSKDAVMDWMENNLENKFQMLMSKSFLKRHHIILKQSYDAYIRGDYQLALLGIYPSVDFFVSNWMKSQEQNEVLVFENPTREQLDKGAVRKLVRTQMKEDDVRKYLISYFELKALEGMVNMYTGSENSLARNSILHGSFYYDAIGKQDYLKVFYLLCALVPLHGVVFSKDRS